jgi:hypothetical protein
VKILFVMEKRASAGSIQAIANYVRTGHDLGLTIAVYGEADPSFPTLRFSADVEAFDYVVFVIEARRTWMSGLRMARMLSKVPWRRRAIVDTDGVYNKLIQLDGYDRNHATERERLAWLEIFHQLTDKILQPTLHPLEPDVIGLPFFGYDPGLRLPRHCCPSKQFDIIHVGHNWWRWREMNEVLLPAIERIRDRINGIAFVGLWWDTVPQWARTIDLEMAFCVDETRLRQLRIDVQPAVPYTEVIQVMSQGQINIMTQRPLLRHLKILTSKYFEIFCADTIPLVMLDPDHAELIYGPGGRQLALYQGIPEKLLDVLNEPEKYRDIVSGVRSYLCAHHSFTHRLQELVAALER